VTYIHDFGEPVPKSIGSNKHVWIITIVDPGDIEKLSDKALSRK
jgi:hypothetical protein